MLENSCEMVRVVGCGFKIEKRAAEMAITGNRGYVKRKMAGFLGLPMAQNVVSSESKFLSLKRLQGDDIATCTEAADG